MTQAPLTGAAGVGQRGPVDHERREQIIQTADEHFRHYGYGKTTVADLAKAIGVSSAYVYRFFDSKQAIGEAVCAMTLTRIRAAMEAVLVEDRSASERLRRVYKVSLEQGLELFFNERKLHEIVIVAITEGWRSVIQHKIALQEIMRKVVIAGRESGEFERKTPLDETSLAMVSTLASVAHPMLLQERSREELEEIVVAVANLVLRSLAP